MIQLDISIRLYSSDMERLSYRLLRLFPVASASASASASTTPVDACATARVILTVADSYFENVLACILLINIGNRQFNFTLSPALQLFPLYLVMKLSRLFLSKET